MGCIIRIGARGWRDVRVEIQGFEKGVSTE